MSSQNQIAITGLQSKITWLRDIGSNLTSKAAVSLLAYEKKTILFNQYEAWENKDISWNFRELSSVTLWNRHSTSEFFENVSCLETLYFAVK